MKARSLKQWLRSPAVIVGEIVALTLAGTLGAVRPELHVFSSVWFAALTTITSASLLVVVIEQAKRLRAQWSQRLTPAHFDHAPFRTEFERPAQVAPASGPPACAWPHADRSPSDSGCRVQIWSERRLGLAGSLVFHIGLLLLITAGALRALFATDAIVDLVEGETLAPTAAAWSAQWPGLFGKPFHLDQPITLESVAGSRYPSGDLRELKAKLSTGEIAVNHQLHVNGGKIYLAQAFGPAALLEWNGTRRAAALLASADGRFEGESTGPDGLRAHLRAETERPSAVEVRVMRGEALFATASLRAGQTLTLPGGASLTLRGTPMWARLHGSRDSALWLAYLGMILVMAGSTMIFTLIKLDCCIVVTPRGERERVFVALKPQRFAPLFQERFEKLVRELGGNCGANVVPEPRCSGVPAERRHPIEPETAALCRDAATARSLPSARVAGVLLLASLLAFTSGCDRVSPAQARQLVERYNQVVSEAYRRGDVRLIDPVVGPNEGKKLTGLIGVRLDLGITLDAKLLSLEITGVEPGKNALRVRTKERWSYRDLKIGTGAQVGEASQDSYEMVYFFTNQNKIWLVDEIKFATPPQVGRKETPWVADRATLHGLSAPAPGNPETNQP